ncbi:MAG: hypothetical protein U9Q37_03425 [Euryarchaeota archaeon]|nr:hypothetical protein [Euryarchaeota archaeon]
MCPDIKCNLLRQIFRKGLQHIEGGGKTSIIISVRYEPKQDLDFITGVLGLTMSETVRSLIDDGRKMKALQLCRHGKVSLGLGAKVAKLTLSEFINHLKEHNVKLGYRCRGCQEGACMFERGSVSGDVTGWRGFAEGLRTRDLLGENVNMGTYTIDRGGERVYDDTYGWGMRSRLEAGHTSRM